MTDTPRDLTEYRFTEMLYDSEMNGAFAAFVLPVPNEVSQAIYEASGSWRVIVKIAGQEWRMGLISDGAGTRVLSMSREKAKIFNGREGTQVNVVIKADPQPDFVEVPPYFEELLPGSPVAQERWINFTTGQKRGLAHYLMSAKRPETTRKRCEEMIWRLAEYQLYGDLHPEALKPKKKER